MFLNKAAFIKEFEEEIPADPVHECPKNYWIMNDIMISVQSQCYVCNPPFFFFSYGSSNTMVVSKLSAKEEAPKKNYGISKLKFDKDELNWCDGSKENIFHRPTDQLTA